MDPSHATHRLFRHTDVFDVMTDDDVDAFTVYLVERRLLPGQVLFAEGDPGDSLFVLLDGTVDVQIATGDGTPVRVATLAPGAILGEGACIDPAPRSATVTAVTPALALELSRAALEQMHQEVPHVASLLLGVILRELTARLRDVDHRIEAALSPAPWRPVSLPPFSPPPRPSAWQRLTQRFLGSP